MMNDPTPQEPEDLEPALERLAAGLSAMGAGDPAPYASLWGPGRDVTLYGAWGPIERGHADVTRTFEWVGSRFSDGAIVPRHDVVHVEGDLAVTVGLEHGDVRVDGGDLRPMTLRVTHVLRRLNGTWRLVHRHADFPPRDQRTS